MLLEQKGGNEHQKGPNLAKKARFRNKKGEMKIKRGHFWTEIEGNRTEVDCTALYTVLAGPAGATRQLQNLTLMRACRMRMPWPKRCDIRSSRSLSLLSIAQRGERLKEDHVACAVRAGRAHAAKKEGLYPWRWTRSRPWSREPLSALRLRRALASSTSDSAQ